MSPSRWTDSTVERETSLGEALALAFIAVALIVGCLVADRTGTQRQCREQSTVRHHSACQR